MRLNNLFLPTARALNFLGADALLGSRHRGPGCVFMLHSVVHDRHDYLNDHLRTSAAFLNEVIAYYISEGIDIVSLDDAMQRLTIPSPRPFVCFTFDDGYKDNKTVALPIFERYSVPLTVFVTTSFINGTLNNWWMGITDLIKRNDIIVVDALNRKFNTSQIHEKIAAFRCLCSEVERGALGHDQLKHLFRTYGISLEQVLDQDSMTVGELRSLSEHPLVEIGGHTENHPHLSHLTADDARREMLDNKVWLEEITDREICHFAYPYGGPQSCGEREFAIARDIGFRTGFTTRVGNLVPEHISRATALPRLRTFNEQESVRLLEFQRCGAASAIATGIGSRVVFA